MTTESYLNSPAINIKLSQLNKFRIYKLILLLFLISFETFFGTIYAQFIQQGPKIIGSGGSPSSLQGCSVAISSDGNTAVVGGYQNAGTGAVWIFIRNNGIWTQQGPKLVGSGAIGLASQGFSVAISADGNTIIEGGYLDSLARGAAWVFTRTNGIWTQQGSKLVGTGTTSFASCQGISVALSADGNTAIVGGPEDNLKMGAVWIFIRLGTNWIQQGPKVYGYGATSQGYQGYSVSLGSDGNTFIEGGPGDNGYNGYPAIGASWIFTRINGVWVQEGLKLVGSGAVGNADQGFSVAISSDGNTAVMGGPVDNNYKGAIWIFKRSNGVWTQQGPKLIGTGSIGEQNWQGNSVVISPDGNYVIESGPSDNSNIGAVWIFSKNGNSWSQLGSKLTGTGAIGQSEQGSSISISSEGTIIEGGPYDNDQTGAVWFFHNPAIGIQPISQNIPEKFELYQNYPNPFNPVTKIRFDVPSNVKRETPNVKIIIYDILGREVSTLVNDNLKPGTYETDWNASNFASGVYFYQLECGDFVTAKKMVLIK